MNNPKSLFLPQEVWQALNGLAERTGSYPLRGKRDAPSTSALLRRIGTDTALLQAIETWLNRPQGKSGFDVGSVVVRPEKPVSETIAWLELSGDVLRVRFPEKHDDFRDTVKSAWLHWEYPYWQRKLSPLSGDPIDRLAELGHRLLSAGFCCAFPDAESRGKAITASYAAEVTRWVLVFTSGEYENWFALRWGRGDDFYDRAMMMTGAKYVKPYIAIPPEHVNEVRDFAKIHGFTFGKSALRLAEVADQMRKNALTVQVSEFIDRRGLEDDAGIVELDVPDFVEVDDELADDI